MRILRAQGGGYGVSCPVSRSCLRCHTAGTVEEGCWWFRRWIPGIRGSGSGTKIFREHLSTNATARRRWFSPFPGSPDHHLRHGRRSSDATRRADSTLRRRNASVHENSDSWCIHLHLRLGASFIPERLGEMNVRVRRRYRVEGGPK